MDVEVLKDVRTVVKVTGEIDISNIAEFQSAPGWGCRRLAGGICHRHVRGNVY